MSMNDIPVLEADLQKLAARNEHKGVFFVDTTHYEWLLSNNGDITSLYRIFFRMMHA